MATAEPGGHTPPGSLMLTQRAVQAALVEGWTNPPAVRGVVAVACRWWRPACATPDYGPMPTPKGPFPTVMGMPTTVLVVVSITVTVLLERLAT